MTVKLAGLFLFFMMAASGHAATLYVGAGQTYPTIQSAFDVVNAGDTIIIKSGTYSAYSTLSRSGNSTNRITICAESGNSQAVVVGNIVINAQWVHLEGLKMEGFNGSVYNALAAVRLYQPNNEVVRMHIQNYAATAIYSYMVGNQYIADNYTYNCASGIIVGSNTIAERNTLERQNRHGSADNVLACMDYFRLFGSNSVIRNNFCYGSSAAECTGGQHLDFIQSWRNVDCGYNLVEGNFVRDWHHQGIMINTDGTYSVHDWTIRNNVFADYTGSAVQAQCTPNFKVENNTFIGNAGNEGWWGVYFWGTGASGVVRNNILIDNQTASCVASGGATMDKDYNLFYGLGAPVAPAAHDKTGDPLFEDRTNKNYRLRSGLPASPALNTGQARSFTTDLEGNARPQGGAFDMGAYEVGANATLLKQAEHMVIHDCTGDVVEEWLDASASGGAVSYYNATAVNDYVTYRAAVPTPGTYNVVVRVKKGSTRGKFQLSIGNPGQGYTNLGAAFDCYASAFSYVDISIGNLVVTSPGCRYFKFLVTGKNAASTGCVLPLDVIKLVKQ